MAALANEISVKSPKATGTETLIKSSDIFFRSGRNGTSEDNKNNKENDEFEAYDMHSNFQIFEKLYSGK